MSKLNSILIAYLVVFSLKAQSTFNIVLGSDRIYVDAINHPLIEKSNDTLIAFTNTVYSNKFGGKCTLNKLDLNGNLIGSYNFLDTLNQPIISNIKYYNNFLILVGSKFTSKDTIESSWICKLDNFLDTIWTIEIKTAYNSPAFYDVKLQKNGNIALCGNDALVRPSGSLIKCNGILNLIDSIGQQIARIELVDPEFHTIFYSLDEDSLGNIYSCGIVKKNNFNNDVIIIKVSPQGKLLWKQQIPSDDFSEGLNYCIPQPNGSILFIGDSYKPSFFDDDFSFVLLLNISSDGQINYTKRILKGFENYNSNCVIDGFGNLVCTGYFKPERNKKADGWICKFTPHGDSIWSRVINNSEKSNEQFFNIAQASDGGYYLTGYSWIEGINTSKAWIVKVDSFGCLVPGCQNVVSTKDIKEGKVKPFSFYPNPVKDVFYFLSRIDASSNYAIHIFNLQGLEVYINEFVPTAGKQYIFNLDNSFAPGQYIIQIQNEKGLIIQSEKIEKF